MSASKSQRSRRAVLGEDGEIQDLDSLLNDSEASDSASPVSPKRDPAPAPATQGESIYCVRCGTANVYDASYCARCGKALVEPGVQAAVNVPSGDQEAMRKSKRDWQSVAESQPIPGSQFAPQLQYKISKQSAFQRGQFNIWSLISRIVMLTFMTGMVISSIAIAHGASSWLGVLALIAWFLVEAVQNGKHHLATLASMISETVTMVFVSGIVITSMAVFSGSSAWIGVIALLAWFLVEAVRH